VNIDEIEVMPDARRTIEGLRDTGYDFLTAIADIVDNSIAAEATRVSIGASLAMDGELEVSVSDDGYGMSRDELLDAMKYGSRVRESPSSLGKFGLGLKTASTAICRQLTVVSRPPEMVEPHAAQWDLDYVAEENRWLLRLPPVSSHERSLLDDVARDSSGTVVIWRKVDRLLPGSHRDNMGAAARNALVRIVDSLKRHLAMTYVRYLSGDEGRPRVEISVNGKRIEPWDPFWSTGSEVLLDKTVPVKIDGEDSSFRLRAFVLPPRSELSESDLRDAEITADRQGFYVFREDRVISAGGWLGMFRIEPHLSLCRIEFSFDHRLDDALQIDIKKSRIRMLADLQEAVKRLVGPARAEATERYRKNQRSTIAGRAPSIHAASNSAVANRIDSLSRATVTAVGPDQARVANPRGEVIISIPTILDADGGPYVVVVEQLQDSLLWRPGLVEGKNAVLLNAGHPFYQRAYSALEKAPVGVQAIDFLLWGLCEAELWAVSDDEREHMEAVRREVSRITRELSQVLPEVEAQPVE
jgi:hypothetical protein